jgi:hypothetical protein
LLARVKEQGEQAEASILEEKVPTAHSAQEAPEM